MMQFVYGIVVKTNDPKRRGRVRCLIPELYETSLTDWLKVMYPFGEKHAINPGSVVLVLVRGGFGGQEELIVLGQIYGDPEFADTVGALSPGSDVGEEDADEYGRTHYIEIDYALKEQFIIKIRGSATSIRINSQGTNGMAQIQIEPGANDVIVGPGGHRFVLEGDPVQVDTTTGRGRVIAGSAQMRGRKIT